MERKWKEETKEQKYEQRVQFADEVNVGWVVQEWLQLAHRSCCRQTDANIL